MNEIERQLKNKKSELAEALAWLKQSAELGINAEQWRNVKWRLEGQIEILEYLKDYYENTI